MVYPTNQVLEFSVCWINMIAGTLASSTSGDFKCFVYWCLIDYCLSTQDVRQIIFHLAQLVAESIYNPTKVSIQTPVLIALKKKHFLMWLLFFCFLFHSIFIRYRILLVHQRYYTFLKELFVSSYSTLLLLLFHVFNFIQINCLKAINIEK